VPRPVDPQRALSPAQIEHRISLGLVLSPSFRRHPAPITEGGFDEALSGGTRLVVVTSNAFGAGGSRVH
jgi:hypothetical protein